MSGPERIWADTADVVAGRMLRIYARMRGRDKSAQERLIGYQKALVFTNTRIDSDFVKVFVKVWNDKGDYLHPVVPIGSSIITG